MTTLNEVADLLVRQPGLKPTTAIKRVSASGAVRGASREADIRRLQIKWKRASEELLKAASDRRNAALREGIAVSSPAPGHVYAASIAAAREIERILNPPGLRAMRDFYDNPTMRALRELQDSPGVRAMREFQDSPAQRAMREFLDSPARRAAREIQSVVDKLAGKW
jgi:hypothetical protein